MAARGGAWRRVVARGSAWRRVAARGTARFRRGVICSSKSSASVPHNSTGSALRNRYPHDALVSPWQSKLIETEILPGLWDMVTSTATHFMLEGAKKGTN